MDLFKYPRTPHLPMSPGFTDDDERLINLDHLLGKEVVITEKMDGENTTLYSSGYLHARSLDYSYHPSRTWVTRFWAERYYLLPDRDIRICGENMYAKHSIHYTDLDSYFLGFSAWRRGMCLSWEDTMSLFDSVGISKVPVLYSGVLSEEVIDGVDKDGKEGFVIRLANEFKIGEFGQSIGKYVRSNHVQTDQHWMTKAVIPNQIRKDGNES